MKQLNLLLISFLGLFLLQGCGLNDYQPSYLLFNETCVIIKIDENRRSWLIQRTTNPNQFAELYTENDPLRSKDSENNRHRFLITTKSYYEKEVGDTIFFDYILTDRFFEIEY